MQWVVIQGPKGDKGDTGEQGSQGLQGEQGPPGSTLYPHVAMARSEVSAYISETVQYVDVDDMSVILTLDETSNVLIFYSCEASPDYDEQILIRALVGETEACPGEIFLTPIIFDYSQTDTYLPWMGSYTYNFHVSSVSPGTYTIKIQWLVTGGVGEMDYRNLFAMAIPVTF